jgi:hypothetical protein
VALVTVMQLTHYSERSFQHRTVVLVDRVPPKYGSQRRHGSPALPFGGSVSKFDDQPIEAIGIRNDSVGKLETICKIEFVGINNRGC